VKKLVSDILKLVQSRNVSYADIRYTCSDSELFYFQRGSLRRYNSNLNDSSLGIRVLVNGCWGFAGINDFSSYSVDRAIDLAISNARHGARFRKVPVEIGTQKSTIGSWTQKPLEDPFLMSRDEKMTYFLELAGRMNGNKKIVNNYLRVKFFRQYKIFANTEGSFVDSLKYCTEPYFCVLASDSRQVMQRTYPGHMSAQSGGFEVVRNSGMSENIERCIKEAVDLLSAPRIEEERADLIIGGGHLALQLHESVGHATEADRMFGMEISYAGKTFVKPEMLGNFKYGSEAVNIVSDSTDPAGINFHLVDDEGVPGKKVEIIKNGILQDQQSSRETALLLGREASSNMLANDGFNYPLIRMSNFNLLPGNAGSLQDLIKSTEKGYFIDFRKTFSIDDNRHNFQFTTEIGWKIQDGEIVGIVKEPTYYGFSPVFWNSCDAICSESEWKYHGTFSCGKGEPGQTMRLSHKTAPARFKNVVINVKA